MTAEQRIALGPEWIARLAGVGRRLAAWPDSNAALDALAARYAVVALTNGSLSQLVAMSAHAGLRWHGLLTSDLAQAFKPDPRMYASRSTGWSSQPPGHAVRSLPPMGLTRRRPA